MNNERRTFFWLLGIAAAMFLTLSTLGVLILGWSLWFMRQVLLRVFVLVLCVGASAQTLTNHTIMVQESNNMTGWVDVLDVGDPRHAGGGGFLMNELQALHFADLPTFQAWTNVVGGQLLGSSTNEASRFLRMIMVPVEPGGYSAVQQATASQCMQLASVTVSGFGSFFILYPLPGCPDKHVCCICGRIYPFPGPGGQATDRCSFCWLGVGYGYNRLVSITQGCP